MIIPEVRSCSLDFLDRSLKSPYEGEKQVGYEGLAVTFLFKRRVYYPSAYKVCKRWPKNRLMLP